MSGTLYIVATPIGNLEDISLRAIKILSDVDIILAEDTRVTRRLLDFIHSLESQLENYSQPLSAKLVSYHQHSGDAKREDIFEMLSIGKNVALVTDAGTPGISDPGNELIDYIIDKNPEIPIVPIPGPSAIITGLSIAGMNVNKFVFLGFWPKKKTRKTLKLIKYARLPFVFYESPYRVIKTLNLIKSEFGEDTKVFIGRELTKMHETLYRGRISDVLNVIGENKIKGEIVVVVEIVKTE